MCFPGMTGRLYGKQEIRDSGDISICIHKSSVACGVVWKRGMDGEGVYSAPGVGSVKITKHSVNSLMSFVALSDQTARVSTVNNGEKYSRSRINYSSHLCSEDETTVAV